MNIENFVQDNVVKTIKDNDDLVVSSAISDNDLLNLIEFLVKFKESDDNKDTQVKLNLKNLNSEQLILIFKYWMKDDVLERLRDSYVILNIIILLKTFNTFDENFFSHPMIFISSMEKFLDVKLDIQDDIKRINCRIADYFISIERSLSKTEYTMLDSYVEIPYFFKSVFISMDLITISGILSTIPDDYHYHIGLVRDANTYMQKIVNSYVMGNEIMNKFIGGIKSGN